MVYKILYQDKFETLSKLHMSTFPILYTVLTMLSGGRATSAYDQFTVCKAKFKASPDFFYTKSCQY